LLPQENKKTGTLFKYSSNEVRFDFALDFFVVFFSGPDSRKVIN
jgi:hypothetical protein